MKEKYFNNLKNNCKKLESIKQYQNNSANVFSLVIPIINSFNDIKNNNDEELINNSLLLITNIKEKNPNLKGVVDAIIDIINDSYKETKATIRRWFYVL